MASARTRARTAAASPTARARQAGGTDRTKYGSSRASTRSAFYVHHMQQVSKAAVMHDARAIRVQIGCLKQRARARGQPPPAAPGAAA